jgi:DNA-binding transcriptional ArsR family regulator
MPYTKPEWSSQSQQGKSLFQQPERERYVNRFLDIVCEHSRRAILELLMPAQGLDTETLERRSGEIAREIGLSASTTSEHLQLLSQAGLITSRRKGNAIFYRVRNQELVQAFHSLIDALDNELIEKSISLDKRT